MRRGVQAVVGCRVHAVRYPRCQRKPISIGPSRAEFARRVAGQRIREVGRRGKRVLLHLDSDDSVVVEPRMTGLLLLADPPNETHLRLELQLSSRSVPRLWYWDRRGLGNVRVLSDRELEEELGPDRLGPDALDISWTVLQQRLATSQREIKVALLDQKVLAGIGNLYASEMLHTAGIHPQIRCDNLTNARARGLHRSMRRILLKAIRYEGSTLGDGTYRNALNRDGSYQNCHRVYMKAGSVCTTCRRAKIRRVVQAQRSTFYCPRCQAKRRPRRSQ